MTGRAAGRPGTARWAVRYNASRQATSRPVPAGSGGSLATCAALVWHGNARLSRGLPPVRADGGLALGRAGAGAGAGKMAAALWTPGLAASFGSVWRPVRLHRPPGAAREPDAGKL